MTLIYVRLEKNRKVKEKEKHTEAITLRIIFTNKRDLHDQNGKTTTTKKTTTCEGNATMFLAAQNDKIK